MDCKPWAYQLYCNHCEGNQLVGTGHEGLLGLPCPLAIRNSPSQFKGLSGGGILSLGLSPKRLSCTSLSNEITIDINLKVIAIDINTKEIVI